MASSARGQPTERSKPTPPSTTTTSLLIGSRCTCCDPHRRPRLLGDKSAEKSTRTKKFRGSGSTLADPARWDTRFPMQVDKVVLHATLASCCFFACLDSRRQALKRTFARQAMELPSCAQMQRKVRPVRSMV
eukprot:scaffold2274_cov343-Pavlova_lutheri.AAC.18